jgi:hypothetical protein
MQTKKEDREKRDKMKAEREAKQAEIQAEKAEKKTTGEKRKPAGDEDPNDKAVAVRQRLQRTTNMDHWENSSANDIRFQLALRGKRDLPGSKPEVMEMVKSMIEDGTWNKDQKPKAKVIKNDKPKEASAKTQIIRNGKMKFWLEKGIQAVKAQLKARNIPVPRSNEKVMEKLRSVIDTPAWLAA